MVLEHQAWGKASCVNRLTRQCFVVLADVQALAQEATAAEQSAANSFYETTKAVRAMQAAAAAAAEAEDRAHAAANMVATLERRLERAREGGRQALAAAAAVTAQLHHSGQC